MSDNITVTAPAVSGSSGGELSLTHEGFPGPFPNFNTLLSIYGAKLQNGTVLSEMLGSVNKTLVERRSDAATMEGFYAGTPDFSGCQNYTEVLYSAWVTNLQILLMMAGSGLSIAPT